MNFDTFAEHRIMNKCIALTFYLIRKFENTFQDFWEDNTHLVICLIMFLQGVGVHACVFLCSIIGHVWMSEGT